MTSTQSLALSLAFKQALTMDLSSLFMENFPKDAVAAFVDTYLPGKTREKVYTISNTLFTMLLSATREDKSLQQAVNLFKQFYEAQWQNFQQREIKLLEEAKAAAHSPRPADRP